MRPHIVSAVISAVFGFAGALSLALLWTRVCPCPKTPLGLFLVFNWLIVGPVGTITGIVTLKRIGIAKNQTTAKCAACAGTLLGTLPLVIFMIAAHL